MLSVHILFIFLEFKTIGFSIFYVMMIIESKHNKMIKEVHLMLTISDNLVINYRHTPSWISSERYLYCDNFARDFAGNRRASFLAYIRKLFRR